MKKYFLLIIATLVISLQSCLGGCSDTASPVTNFKNDTIPRKSPERTVSFDKSEGEMRDFVTASKSITPSVVHIKTTYEASGTTENPPNQLYGLPGKSSVVMGSASAIIISTDGYIATNNQVVENSANIEVILLDKRVFTATLIGRDPNTDLALLKINTLTLSAVRFGNSDIVQVGEWVLAVGYPFSLNTTVTA